MQINLKRKRESLFLFCFIFIIDEVYQAALEAGSGGVRWNYDTKYIQFKSTNGTDNWIDYKYINPDNPRYLMYWYNKQVNGGSQTVVFNHDLDYIIVGTARSYNYGSGNDSTGAIEATSINGLIASKSSTLTDPNDVFGKFSQSSAQMQSDYVIGDSVMTVISPYSIFTSMNTIHRAYYNASNIKQGDSLKTYNKNGSDAAYLIICGIASN